MNRAKQKRPAEHRFPITFLLVPIQTLREALKAYFAFRSVDYHFRQDYKFIFQNSTSRRCNHGNADSSPKSSDYFPLRCAVLRRKLVNAAVAIHAAVHSRAVEVTKSIDDHAVVRKTPIWRAREGMNNTLSPLPAADRS